MTRHLNNGIGIPKGSTLKTHSLMGPNFELLFFFFKYTSVSQKETRTGCPQRSYLSQSQKRERTFGQRHGELTAEGGWFLNEGLVCSPGSGGPTVLQVLITSSRCLEGFTGSSRFGVQPNPNSQVSTHLPPLPLMPRRQLSKCPPPSMQFTAKLPGPTGRGFCLRASL